MSENFPQSLLDTITATPLVAGFSVEDPATAVPIAKALLAGGIKVIELTMRTPTALDGIRAIVQHVPDIIIGVGTILTPQQVIDVQTAGAAFGVSPGLNPDVVNKAKEVAFPFAPGVLTPSELEKSIGLGCRFVKVFPAEAAGGVTYLKSIYAPYRHLGISFFPLGGIHKDNLKDYLHCDGVRAAGGSWLVQAKDVQEERYDRITERCKAALSNLKL
jgi:2-dehydro-3-deoxyphosphogluconate aldolase/(4S)-4-hydroxy-2-oxoglutarate aldolase